MEHPVFGSMIAMAAVVAVLALAPLAAAAQAPTAAAKTWDPPRTPDGQPDFQGIWEVQTAGGFPQYSLEGTDLDLRHNLITQGRADQTYKSMVVDPADGKIPYQPWAKAKKRENFENHTYPTKPEYIDGRTRCHVPGVPRQIWSGEHQIIQTPGYVLMMIEWTHAYRIIPLDGRPHLGGNIRLYQGDSRGRWEGNTLLIDVTNSNGREWLDAGGDFYSDALHVVERWTFIDADTIHYAVTLEDPKVYTRPWKMVFTLTRLKEKGYELLEHACHEGERATQSFLSYSKPTESAEQKTR